MSLGLELTEVEKHYPVSRGRHKATLHAVDGVSLSIGKGESVGLVGESGCGKSTLVRLISRLIDITGGTIRLNGEDIGGISPRAFGTHPARSNIQVVFQDPTDSLNPNLRVFDSIADPVRRLMKLEGRKAVEERVADSARMVGLPQELLTRYPHQLSGGQKARVGIARAIAVEPQLLILDEPTSALDVSVQAVILHLLDDLRRRLGVSYLFVSHDLNVVRLLCERVAVMYLGKIIEVAPVEDIFLSPRHPYTQALVAAIPDPARRGNDERPAITGEPRSPIDPDPAVCRFYGRCPKGTELCTQKMPALEPAHGSHRVACHFAEPPAPAVGFTAMAQN
ncbi:MAG: peptide ABC transporter ATP-binding protein [Rhodospirillaceae bacterium]|nr:peptide ABC transporter ATP-binding protein [Rhodospirillaceae bacterium]